MKTKKRKTKENEEIRQVPEQTDKIVKIKAQLVKISGEGHQGFVEFINKIDSLKGISEQIDGYTIALNKALKQRLPQPKKG